MKNRHRLVEKLRPVSALMLPGIVGSSFLPSSVTRSESAGKAAAANPVASEPMPNLQGDEAVEHLKQTGTYDSLEEAIGAIWAIQR
jgi:hypothetical protein